MGLAPPQYWTSNGEGFSLAVASPEELQALSKGLRPGGSFGGRDQRKGGSYNTLQVTRAWRLQHPGLWGKYAMERENLRSMDMKALKACNIEVKPIKVRDDFEQMMKELPADLDKELNEVYLSHGSKPEILPAIFAGGLNERYSGGLFGNGTYFAEDIAKNDQYCTPDQRYGDAPALHKMLYDATGLTHPGQVYYVFVCRVLLGHEIRTKDGSTVLDEAAAGGRAKSIWSSQSRELACVEGSNPPVLHHSLVVELGAKLLRFREFIVYHGDRIYPEYLVAYQRV